jgi:hypothetical protein
MAITSWTTSNVTLGTAVPDCCCRGRSCALNDDDEHHGHDSHCGVKLKAAEGNASGNDRLCVQRWPLDSLESGDRLKMVLNGS